MELRDGGNIFVAYVPPFYHVLFPTGLTSYFIVCQTGWLLCAPYFKGAPLLDLCPTFSWVNGLPNSTEHWRYCFAQCPKQTVLWPVTLPEGHFPFDYIDERNYMSSLCCLFCRYDGRSHWRSREDIEIGGRGCVGGMASRSGCLLREGKEKKMASETIMEKGQMMLLLL
jgi:hypothetical protein